MYKEKGKCLVLKSQFYFTVSIQRITYSFVPVRQWESILEKIDLHLILSTVFKDSNSIDPIVSHLNTLVQFHVLCNVRNW